MNKEVKMLARKVFMQGPTKGIYEKLSAKQVAARKALSDEEYIRLRYRENVGGELDLDNPKTLNEKLNWLKLHDIHPEYTTMVDKYAVKKYVADKVGKQYVVPLYGVWDHFDDIDFDSLPNEFILKVTHDSSGQVICTDKKTFDYDAAKEKLETRLSYNAYEESREYPYRDVPRRIIAEKYIESLGHPDSVEYKLTVMNGEVKFITVCKGKAHDSFEARTNDHYDREGKILPFYAYYKNSEVPVPLPEQTEEMIEISEKLGKGIPYVRIDFYIVDGKVMFGEMTFFTWGGFIQFTPEEWDRKLGDMLELPSV